MVERLKSKLINSLFEPNSFQMTFYGNCYHYIFVHFRFMGFVVQANDILDLTFDLIIAFYVFDFPPFSGRRVQMRL